MTRENNGRRPTFWELFNKTHRLTRKDSHGMCSQRAAEIEEQVYAKADALLAQGVENIDYDAIFADLFGKVKKRKQVPGAGHATSIYFPFATSSSTSAAARSAEVEQRVQELREQVRVEVTNEVQERMQLVMQDEIAKVREESDKKTASLQDQLKILSEQFNQLTRG
ncbi:uncharacterized protein LOC125216414 isoform X1 [Salvia hispanica]|uniref:uncharacterized protein LOC125216414 isoform X1 n=1 Tax=Salvia hispanica TaxID=49212 RepID=UPI0020090651|nr:uncharacterized protein LOC125216414 isoform X1 [Salvia hispanica]